MIKGILIKAGDIRDDDETFSGVILSVEKESFLDNRVPLYEECVVLRRVKYEEMRSELQRLQLAEMESYAEKALKGATQEKNSD